MKKYFKLFFVFAVLFLIPFVSHVSASQVVNVYLFKGDGCPHCAEAEEFFTDLKKDSKYASKFNLVEYEVWYNQTNSKFMEKVADKLDTSVTGVPFIVIGEEYFRGYASSYNQEIKNEIDYAYSSNLYEDVVAAVKNGSSSSNSYNYSNRNSRDDFDYDADRAIDIVVDNVNGVNKEVATIFAGTFLVLFLTIFFIALAIEIYLVIVYWQVFKKAGRNGWEAIIPFYNLYVLFEISGYPGYYMFFGFIPCAGPIILFVFQIMAAISLAKKFKKGDGFHVLLWLLPVIGYSILAFGKDTYDDSLGEHKNKKENQTNGNDQPKEEPKEEKKEETKKTTKESGRFCTECGAKVTKTAKHCNNCGKELE